MVYNILNNVLFSQWIQHKQRASVELHAERLSSPFRARFSTQIPLVHTCICIYIYIYKYIFILFDRIPDVPRAVELTEE